MDKYILLDLTYFCTCQGRHICSWLVHLHSMALNSNVAGLYFWLLQPVFSHNKAVKHG